MKKFKLLLFSILMLFSISLFAQDSTALELATGNTDVVNTETSIKDYILGGIPITYLWAFIILGNIGMIFSLLLHYNKKRKDFIKNKSKITFSFKFWLADNAVRVLTSEIALFVVLRFGNNFWPKFTINLFLAFLCGLLMDRLIMYFRSTSKINIFQKS